MTKLEFHVLVERVNYSEFINKYSSYVIEVNDEFRNKLLCKLVGDIDLYNEIDKLECCEMTYWKKLNIKDYGKENLSC